MYVMIMMPPHVTLKQYYISHFCQINEERRTEPIIHPSNAATLHKIMKYYLRSQLKVNETIVGLITQNLLSLHHPFTSISSLFLFELMWKRRAVHYSAASNVAYCGKTINNHRHSHICVKCIPRRWHGRSAP